MSDGSNKSLPKVSVVQLDSGDVEVKKLPLGKYALVLQELEKLPAVLEQITSQSTDEIVQQLPAILATSWSDVVGIISIATGVSKAELEEEIGLDEAVSLVTAVIEVNNFFSVAQNLGKLRDVWQERAAQYNRAQLIKAVEKSGKRTGKTGSRK